MIAPGEGSAFILLALVVALAFCWFNGVTPDQLLHSLEVR